MKRWRTAGGVVVVQNGPRVRVVDGRGLAGWKIRAYRESDGQPMGYHGLVWVKNLTRLDDVARESQEKRP